MGKKETRKSCQKVRADFLPRRPAAGRSLSCPLFGGAATAPPPAYIAAYCSRAAPPSDDAAKHALPSAAPSPQAPYDGPIDAALPRSGGMANVANCSSTENTPCSTIFREMNQK
jgi:hypothetical protein